MRAIHFPEANTQFNKPEEMTDEQCYSISAYVGRDENGVEFVGTCWMPNKEDIEAILAGRPVVLYVYGGGLPPVSLLTFDAVGNPNC